MLFLVYYEGKDSYKSGNLNITEIDKPWKNWFYFIAEEDAEDEVKREKKSVRFNEVVQRQVYRSNSSILGQKMKNQKKNQQKMRKRAERRASEGDTPSSTPDFKDSEKSARIPIHTHQICRSLSAVIINHYQFWFFIPYIIYVFYILYPCSQYF